MLSYVIAIVFAIVGFQHKEILWFLISGLFWISGTISSLTEKADEIRKVLEERDNWRQ